MLKILSTAFVLALLHFAPTAVLAEEKNSEEILQCVNKHVEENAEKGQKTLEGVLAQPLNDFLPEHFVIQGNLGWKVTWKAIIHMTADPATAFETYGAEGASSSGLFRKEIPEKIVTALDACGIPFGGVFPNAVPWS